MDPPQPTKFPELNAIVAELAERAARILGANFVGAYLQGSFAVGDADLQSDCDFLIPVRRQVSAAQEAGLRAMHAGFPDRPEHWAQHLEGPIRRWPVTLAGPDPRTLVDEVPATALRARMHSYASGFLPDMQAWIGLDVAWGQRYTA